MRKSNIPKPILYRNILGKVIKVEIWSKEQNKMVIIDDKQTISIFMKKRRDKRKAGRIANFLNSYRGKKDFQQDTRNKKKTSLTFKNARKGKHSGR